MLLQYITCMCNLPTYSMLIGVLVEMLFVNELVQQMISSFIFDDRNYIALVGKDNRIYHYIHCTKIHDFKFISNGYRCSIQAPTELWQLMNDIGQFFNVNNWYKHRSQNHKCQPNNTLNVTFRISSICASLINCILFVPEVFSFLMGGKNWYQDSNIITSRNFIFLWYECHGAR